MGGSHYRLESGLLEVDDFDLFEVQNAVQLFVDGHEVESEGRDVGQTSEENSILDVADHNRLVQTTTQEGILTKLEDSPDRLAQAKLHYLLAFEILNEILHSSKGQGGFSL